jgi:hypothetical protein
MSRIPSSVVALVALVIVIGVIWYSSAQIVILKDQVKSDESQLRRYRVVLGIDPATKSSAKELTNRELQLKAAALIPQLTDMCNSGTKDLAEIQRLLNVEMIDDNQKEQRTGVVRKQLSERFRTMIGDESFVVDNELRRRIDPQLLNTMTGITKSVIADDGTYVDILSQVPPSADYDIGMTCSLSQSLDRLGTALLMQH